MNTINTLNSISSFTTGGATTTKSSEQGGSFRELLTTAIREVNQLQLDADTAARELLLGQVEIHQAMIAMEKASLVMDLTIQVRNKLIEAYQEIMRMQI